MTLLWGSGGMDLTPDRRNLFKISKKFTGFLAQLEKKIKKNKYRKRVKVDWMAESHVGSAGGRVDNYLSYVLHRSAPHSVTPGKK